MSDPKPKIQKSRRKLLSILSAGAVAAKLPELWSKPTVASVMLPAHATTTGPQCDSAELIIAGVSPPNGSYTINLVGYAFGLPSGPIYYGLFSYYGGSVLAGLTVQGGSHAASVQVTVPNSAYCSVLALDIVAQGALNTRLCFDTNNLCVIATMTVIGP